MHMNSIRWKPMIRWLKFPFWVRILHKTVQLSVHELRGGYVCICLKACPTVPPSPWEQGGTVFNIFLCFCISFLWSMNKLLWSQHYFVFSINALPKFHVLHLVVVLENMLYAIESHYILGFLMIGVILIISFPYKTGNHNALLWKF